MSLGLTPVPPYQFRHIPSDFRTPSIPFPCPVFSSIPAFRLPFSSLLPRWPSYHFRRRSLSDPRFPTSYVMHYVTAFPQASRTSQRPLAVGPLLRLRTRPPSFLGHRHRRFCSASGHALPPLPVIQEVDDDVECMLQRARITSPTGYVPISASAIDLPCVSILSVLSFM
ncbi:hypothetical protein BOTBODRAFT_175931 [Botryobasidium botryosum FD-172 SS1]|uniref:Uncharacterized protein n=1 Tax=Botryobasidium botryosum (strain FD-172 SS1) TaxID=930990 RepID=A0A067MBX1_BOTB1|nr:hypothetical protein BOTBODRAFT_175931 [Botryobasidium botryosum FD-172 SS1]